VPPTAPRRTPRRVVLGTIAAVALLATAGGSVAVEGPSRVLGGPQDQLLPAVNETYLVWTESSEAHPNRYHAFAKVLGTTTRVRLNPSGTRGYTGGIDPGQDRAIYQRIDGQRSDLYLVDLQTRAQSRLPAAVNTTRWEWGPRISDRFVLFARDTALKTTIVLWDRVDRTVDQLAGYDFTRFYASPGAVGQRYATWSVCGPLTCNAWIYDTQLDTTRRIPAPDGRARYAPVVDEAGDQVYFVRSGQSCGANVRIMRVPVDALDAVPVTLTALPAGIDVGFTLSVARPPGQVDLWFARFRCAPQQGDIFRLRDVGVA
jgi:hypothetical protein